LVRGLIAAGQCGMELGAGKRKLHMPKPQLYDFTRKIEICPWHKNFRWTRNLLVGYQSNEETQL